MSSVDWQQVEKILHGALEREPGEHAAFLDWACPTPEIRREVEALLRAEEHAVDFLESPACRSYAGWLPGAGETASPERVGPYRLLREIGSGGTSSVYLAERDDGHFRQQVAVKLIHRGPLTPELVRRFRIERQILARLDHPNIAKIYDGGATEDGRLYFVMAYVDGPPIDRFCEQRELALRDRLEVFLQVCSAVSYAQQHLIVHRDLKPSNILVTGDGTPKLLDFGIAKILEPDDFPEPVEQTVFGLRPMTPQYASPEQLRGGAVTTATDVYALGLVLYLLLTGRRPYELRGLSAAEVERLVCVEEPSRPSVALGRAGDDGAARPALRPAKLRGELDNIVLRALAKDPRRRYPSSRHLAEDLERYLEGRPVSARPVTWWYRSRKYLRRNALAVGAAAAILVLLLGFLVSAVIQSARLERERDQARQDRDRAEQVSGFLIDIFSGVEPSRARGETVSAREILDQGVVKIDQGLADQPQLQSRLMETMAHVYRELGLYDPAIELLERSLDNRRRLASVDLELAQVLEDLAGLWIDKDEYGKAGVLLREALAIRRRQGEHHVAEGLGHLASLRLQEGSYEAAEGLYRQVLAIQTEASGHPQLEIAGSLNGLALTLDNRGEREAAAELYQEALAIYRRERADHPDVATLLHNLGSLYYAGGERARARNLLSEALEMRRRILGREHPKTTKTLANLSLVLVDLDPAAALPVAQEALANRRQVFGEDHRAVAHSLAILAYVLEKLGRVAEAEEHYRASVASHRKSLPPDHPLRANPLLSLGALLNETGRPEAAETPLREALELGRNGLPSEHRLVFRAAIELGRCLVLLRRFEEAEPLLLEGFDKSRERDVETARRAARHLVALYEARGMDQRVAPYRAFLSGQNS